MYPVAPKEFRTEESIRLTMGLSETEFDASTAARAKKLPAISNDERVMAKSKINP